MYEIDFVSVVVGYIVGFILCYSISKVIFMENENE